jgi:hypothetical protein
MPAHLLPLPAVFPPPTNGPLDYAATPLGARSLAATLLTQYEWDRLPPADMAQVCRALAPDHPHPSLADAVQQFCQDLLQVTSLLPDMHLALRPLERPLRVPFLPLYLGTPAWNRYAGSIPPGESVRLFPGPVDPLRVVLRVITPKDPA